MEKKEVILRPVILNERLPKELAEDARINISSSWTASGQLLTGLTKEEIYEIFPDILGMKPEQDYNAFNRAVEEYYANINIKLNGVDGVRLNASIGDNGKPVVPEQYVKYKLASVHSYVAKTKDERENTGMYTAELVDVSEAERAKKKVFETQLKAEEHFHKLMNSGDADKISYVADLLGIRGLNDYDLEMELKEIRDEDPERFIDVCEDEHLETKSMLIRMVNAGIVEVHGNSFIYGNETLGSSEMEAIAFMENKSKSETLLRMHEQLKAAYV